MFFLFITYVIVNIIFLSMCLTGVYKVTGASVGLLGTAGLVVSVVFGEVVLKKKSNDVG